MTILTQLNSSMIFIGRFPSASPINRCTTVLLGLLVLRRLGSEHLARIVFRHCLAPRGQGDESSVRYSQAPA